MSYKFLKQIRLASIVVLWVGLFFHIPMLFFVGFVVWGISILAPQTKMERFFYALQEHPEFKIKIDQLLRDYTLKEGDYADKKEEKITDDGTKKE